MEINREQVLHIAKLSHLNLEEGEVEKYRADLSAIISYMEKLNQADTSGVEARDQVFPSAPLMRPDEVRPPLTVGEVLKNAPDQDNGHLLVPKVIA